MRLTTDQGGRCRAWLRDNSMASPPPFPLSRALTWMLGLLLAVLAAGCGASGYTSTYQPATDSIQAIAGEFGQTLHLYDDGWQGMALVLEGADYRQTADVFLFTHPEGELIAQSRLDVPAFEGRRWVPFAWPSSLPSFDRSYRLRIAPAMEQPLLVGTGLPHTYEDGSLYLEDRPHEAQLAMRLMFAWDGLIGNGLSWLGGIAVSLLAVFLVFCVPGWGLVAWIHTHRAEDPLWGWPARMCAAIGLSVALYPLLYLWFDLVGLHPGPGIPLLAMGLGLVLLMARTLRLLRHPGPEGLPAFMPLRITSWADTAFLAVLAGLILSRFWTYRTVHAPYWGDSVQHAYIAQLMLERGGLFDSWLPYAEFTSFTNHFGFHANASALGFVLNLDGIDAAFQGGQWLNIASVLALYPLTVHIASGNRWAGVAAVLCGGLLSEMPAMYVNWGRYAQLSGQVVLPVAILLLWRLAELRHWNFIAAAGAAVALGGMALCYYRMPLFYAAFAVVLLLGWILPVWGWDAARWRQGASNLAAAAGISVGLIAPQILRLQESILLGRAAVSLRGASENWVWNDYQIWRSLPDYYPKWLQQWAAGAWLWSIVVAHHRAFVAGVWGITLMGLVALSLLRIPLMSELQNFAVVIAMFMPFSVLNGWSFGWLLEWLAENAGQSVRRILAPAAFALCLVTMVAFLPLTQNIRDDQYSMVTAPDEVAMAWMHRHLPQDARILVPGYRVYGGRTIVGSDAGWWIPLYTGLHNSMPPQYALLERPIRENQVQAWVNLVASLEVIPISSPMATRLLCEQGYSHVFLGQKREGVGFELRQLYTAEQLADNPALRPVYAQDRVLIYEVPPAVCEELVGRHDPARPEPVR